MGTGRRSSRVGPLGVVISASAEQTKCRYVGAANRDNGQLYGVHGLGIPTGPCGRGHLALARLTIIKRDLFIIVRRAKAK